MLGEPVTAERALSLGLVTSVVDDQELVGPAQELAARLAGRPTAAYAAIKESPPYAATHSLAEALEKETQVQALARVDPRSPHGHPRVPAQGAADPSGPVS